MVDPGVHAARRTHRPVGLQTHPAMQRVEHQPRHRAENAAGGQQRRLAEPQQLRAALPEEPGEQRQRDGEALHRHPEGKSSRETEGEEVRCPAAAPEPGSGPQHQGRREKGLRVAVRPAEHPVDHRRCRQHDERQQPRRRRGAGAPAGEREQSAPPDEHLQNADGEDLQPERGPARADEEGRRRREVAGERALTEAGGDERRQTAGENLPGPEGHDGAVAVGSEAMQRKLQTGPQDDAEDEERRDRERAVPEPQGARAARRAAIFSAAWRQVHLAAISRAAKAPLARASSWCSKTWRRSVRR